MPKVYNIKDGFPKNAVLVDRMTEFGNPFVIGKDGTRGEVIDKHKKLVDNDLEFQDRIRQILKDKDLVCHCKPKACHADYLLIVANTNSLF